MTEEIRSSESFSKISNSTSVDIFYQIADTFGITISAEENLIDYIETEVSNNELEISTRHNTYCIDFNERPVITITAPFIDEAYLSGSGNLFMESLSGDNVVARISGSGDISADMISCNDLTIRLSGSGNIKCNDIECATADVLLSGSGDITLKGTTNDSQLKISGSGNIYSEGFPTLTSGMTISGSGNIYSNVINQLNAIISGSGNIYLKGDPEIHHNITGSGRIIKH